MSLDVRETPPERRLPGVVYAAADIRDRARLEALLREHRIATVVHLAAIVTPGKKADRDFEYQVDVVGTKNVLDACVAAGVGHVVISSSGAAYGYHADNPAWLSETTRSAATRSSPTRGTSGSSRRCSPTTAASAPQLQQTVFRIGTILGETVANQITALFDKPRPLAIAGADSPFVFIWDQDVVGAILHALSWTPQSLRSCPQGAQPALGRPGGGLVGGPPGIYNLAGDGALTIHEIAARMGKRCRVLPPWLLQTALWIGKRLGLTQYGPEQLRFLRYRPVLDNARLKAVFGYVPRKTSAEVFDFWWAARRARSGA